MPGTNLLAWRLCHDLALTTYSLTKVMPRDERYGITAQARRAAFSAAVNIVEGAAKRGKGEFGRFLDIALGSLAELEYWFLVIRDLELLPESSCDSLDRALASASKVTWKLYESIRRGSRQRHAA